MKTVLYPLALLLAPLPALAEPETGGQSQTQTLPRYGSFGIDLTARDAAVAPGDDFWAYANGAWAAGTPIPPSIDAVGVAPQQSRNMETLLHGVLETAARNSRGDPYARLVGDFYGAFMDGDAIERAGLGPAKPYLDAIGSARNGAAIQLLLARVPHAGLIAIEVTRDPLDPGANLVRVGQGELGMPRDYYLQPGESYDGYRRAYGAYVAALLKGAGLDDADQRAAEVVALETRLAQGFWGPAERRDMERNDRRMTLDELRAAVPGFDWPAILREAGLETGGPLILGEDSALAALAAALREVPLPVWQDYLRFRFLSDHADFLPARFADARFAFYSGTLSGITEQAPRWRRAITLTNNLLGEAVSQVYARQFLDPVTVAQVGTIFEDLRTAFRARIEASAWMDAETKRGAIAKLDTMTARIGKPEGVPDFTGLKLSSDRPLDNAIAIERFHAAKAGAELRRRGTVPEWPFRAQDGNGFYYASANAVLLAGGLLFPPFFDPNADPAVNYGAIGAFIGHEMGHAFDDHGSRYDAEGREADWWSAASRAAFEERTAALRDQYGAYEALPGLKVDGTLTLGENIADLGGLEAAYDAYQLYQKREGKAQAIDGLTGEQRFFLANAQMRRTVVREDVLRQLATFDTHAPSNLRVNGTLRNMDAWYAAFDVQPGDRLYLAPERRIRIW